MNAFQQARNERNLFFKPDRPLRSYIDCLLNLALGELSHKPLNYDNGRLETLLLHPVEGLELCNPLSSYRDPDSSFVIRLPTGKYVVKKEVNYQFDLNNKVSFSTMQVNARSLLMNFDKFKIMWRNMQKLFSVIGVSKPWVRVNITGYNLVQLSYVKSLRRRWNLFTKWRWW